MGPHAEAAAPATGAAATKSSRHQAADLTSIAPGTDAGQDTPADESTVHVRDALVLVVLTGDGRCRRTTYLTVAGAERAAERARDRGHRADVVLCHLVPVQVVA
ncbi:hypothetical protein [Kineococcus terrestris]|uniref:hypothetical protein n=1 Tax=Kineococcus terrestris TaxID=2044856 RepID=UPI0034DB5350